MTTRTTQTANALIARERLDYFADMLIASGWKRDGEHWLAPERYAEALRLEVGRGAVSLRVAVQAQVMFDEITVERDMAQIIFQSPPCVGFTVPAKDRPAVDLRPYLAGIGRLADA